MSDSLESLFTLISARIHKRGTLMALVDSPTAQRFEIRPPRPNEALTWRDQDEATKFVRRAAQDVTPLALICDGPKVVGSQLHALSAKEIRFFRPQTDPKNGEVRLTQASRLHAGVMLTRLQMRNMLPRDLCPCGPHRSYQQLYLPAPFV